MKNPTIKFNDFFYPAYNSTVDTNCRGKTILTVYDGPHDGRGVSYLSNEDAVALACHILTSLVHTVDPDVITAYAQSLVDDVAVDNSGVELTLARGVDKSETIEGEAAPEPARKYTNLSPQAQLIYKHMQNAGSISARDAFTDHGITSAVLSRRITDIVREGFAVTRERRKHPLTDRLYTRYSLA